MAPQPQDPAAVNALIEGGGGPDEIAGHFKTFHAAMAYYGQNRAHRYAPGNVTGECAFCGNRQDVGTVRCRWAGTREPLYMAPFLVAAALLGEFASHLLLHYTVRFSTYHSMCAACRRAFMRSLFRRGLLHAAGLALIGVGILPIIGWIFPVIESALVDVDDPAHVRLWGGLGVAMMVFGIWCLWWWKRHGPPLPAPLDGIGRPPFALSWAISTPPRTTPPPPLE